MPGEDEPLHAFITATTQESVTKAVNKVGLNYNVLVIHRFLTEFFFLDQGSDSARC